MDAVDDLKYFPVSPFLHFHIYHPYGNTPPEDLLQSVNRVVKEPQILLLGCGDLRSCFFTLWSNFYRKHLQCFKGVHFVLNDSSAAVLARNIIFLYLCTQMPADYSDRIKWVASFWSIWYCHELLPHHKEVLVSAISRLLRWSGSCEAWSENTENPLRSLVKFFTPATLSKVHHVWKMWYKDTSTVEGMRRSRDVYFRQLPTESLQDPVRHLFDFFGGILFKNVTSKERNKMKQDIEYYYKKGFAFAEEIFGLPLEEPKSANCTFIDNPHGGYNLPCTFTPYRSYFFTFQFSPKNLEKFGIDFPLMIGDEHFTDHPLLANSVQLFSIWIRSCADILSRQQHNILFTFQCSDALEFCLQLHNKPHDHLPQRFDAIYTSNLIDYIAPPSLVLLTMPVLKFNGSLFTTVLYYHSESNTSTEFLKTCFGYDCKHLQLLCGVRCLGYENEYSDTISVKPLPFLGGVDTALYVGVRSSVWRHATGMALKQITENHFSSMWSVLSASIVHLLTYFGDHHNSCTGTVMTLLQSFASQFDKEYNCSSYQFWSPLCELLLKQKSLQSYITSLQTQALLHGVHLHLTVSETNCPLCNNQPVLQTIAQYSFTVQEDISGFMKRVGKFTLLAYSDRSIVNVYNWKPSDSNAEFHVIDTFDASVTDKKLRIEFFAPISFLQEDYCISLAFCGDLILAHGKIERSKIAYNKYLFNQMRPSCTTESLTPLSLGVVLQHSGNDSSFETVISLSDRSISTLQDHQLTTEQCSDTIVRIKVNDCFSDVVYPYSIDYNKLTIQLSRRSKKVTIFANRKCHCIYDEEPVYITNPSNVLSLPIMPINQADATSFCELQWMRQRASESEDPCILNLNHGTDEYELKQTFLHLFQSTDKCSFFLINKYDGDPRVRFNCLITVINRVFDVHNKVPGLDILYCNSDIDEYLFSAFNPNKMKYDSIQLDKAERELCSKMLNYFTKCTVATSPPVTNATYKSLVKRKVEHHFKRAVIYPLYPNLDEKMFNSSHVEMIKTTLIQDMMPIPKDFPYWFHYTAACLKENKCSYCKCIKEGLKKCSRCHLVQYCDANCQKKHWKTHKPSCNVP